MKKIGLLVIFLLSLTVFSSPCQSQSHYLFIYHIEVGQGDSTLIVSPEGKTLLVDGGNNGMGNRKVIPLLKVLGITSLDYMVATHYDADHIGGFDEVLKYVGNVEGAAYDRGDPEKESPTKTYRDYVRYAGEKRTTIHPGDKIDLGANIEVECVAVNGEVSSDAAISPADVEENAGSVALRLRYGKFDYFIGGDLTGGGRSGSKWTEDVESEIAPQVGDVDVIRVNHHGSLTSSNATFLAVLSPEVAIVSVGNGGSNRSRYHHPSREVLDRFLGLQGLLAIFQTNRGETLGGLTADDLEVIRVERRNVVLFTDGETYMVNGEIFPVDE